MPGTGPAWRQLRKAIELNPNYATAHLWYGYHLERLGRFSEGLRERQRAYAIDPLNIVISDAFAQALELSGQTERAKAQFMRTLELFPESRVVHEDVGMFFEGQGQYDMAIQEFKRAGSMDSLAHLRSVGQALCCGTDS